MRQVSKVVNMLRRVTQRLTDMVCVIFFFNDTATTEIYTLSLHDALPISFATIGDK